MAPPAPSPTTPPAPPAPRRAETWRSVAGEELVCDLYSAVDDLDVCGIMHEPTKTVEVEELPGTWPTGDCACDSARLGCGHVFSAPAIALHFLVSDMRCPMCRAGPTGPMHIESVPAQIRVAYAAKMQRVKREAQRPEDVAQLRADILTMDEVQGSVRLGAGSTVVLYVYVQLHILYSTCNYTGRGEIRAEVVMGLARGFLFAGAAATVVSLWSVDDGSTAALMKEMYKHLKDGRTTAQALQLAMLHLLKSGRDSRWRQPLYWAAFLVVGANTRLPGV